MKLSWLKRAKDWWSREHVYGGGGPRRTSWFAWFATRTTPKGGNVDRSVVRRRRMHNRMARASRKRNRRRM